MSEAVAMTRPEVEDDFEAFVHARGDALWRSAWLLTGDSHRAEDLVQTTLGKCWPKWERINANGSFEAYARRVMLTTYLAWWRRRWNGEVPTEKLPESASNTGLADTRTDLMRALSALPKGQRAVIVLRYFDDLTEQQTAEALGCSIGTVKSQASRALKALRVSGALTEEES